MREHISKLLPHNNSRCVAPPGVLCERCGIPIVISSVMRSGTHLVIDLILNNFSDYRHTPLYLDIDQYFSHKLPHDRLEMCGNAVIKTHYPFDGQDKERAQALTWLANHGKVIRPTRSIESVWESLQNFRAHPSREVFEQEVAAHNEFWSQFDYLEVPFDAITNPDKATEVLKSIADFIGQPMPNQPILPYRLNQLNCVVWSKALTRIFGAHAPRINTTIKFARTPGHLH